MYTDQWLCPCSYYNSFLRKKCRNCNEPMLPDEKIIPFAECVEGRLPRGPDMPRFSFGNKELNKPHKKE